MKKNKNTIYMLLIAGMLVSGCSNGTNSEIESEGSTPVEIESEGSTPAEIEIVEVPETKYLKNSFGINESLGTPPARPEN